MDHTKRRTGGYYPKIGAILAFLSIMAASACVLTIHPAASQTAGGPAVDPNAYLWTQINRAKDPNNMTHLEKTHVPGITIAGPVKAGVPFKVTVRVGIDEMHPSQHGHFIQWIELYNGDLQLGHVDLPPATAQPEATFTVVMDNPGTLKARQNCNLHGTWENTRPVAF